MKRNNLVVAALLAVGLLAGCAKTDQTAAAPTGNAEKTAAAPAGNTEKTAVAEEKDVSQNANVLKEKKFDQLTKEEWDKIRLSKKDFNELLEELSKKDDNSAIQKAVLIDNTTLEITLANTGGETIGNTLVVGLFDPILRELYMHSSYYKNDKQPVIRFVNSAGAVVAEHDNFVKPKN
ncbi:hypothetical protein ACFCP7_25650 [Paenibacillus elgii]